jgi:autotransporter-associated beta strand protein
MIIHFLNTTTFNKVPGKSITSIKHLLRAAAMIFVFMLVAGGVQGQTGYSNVTISASATSGGSFAGTAPNITFTPTANNANINVSALVTQLLTNNVTIVTARTGGTQAGNVTFSAALTAATTSTTQRTFTVTAGGSIYVNSAIDLTPASANTGVPATDIVFTAGTSGNINIVAAITTTGGAASGFNKNGGIAGDMTFNAPRGINITANLTNAGGAKTGSGTAGAAGNYAINDGNSTVTTGGVNDGQTSGVISGGTLTKSGSGTLVLAGSNTYTGLTTISAGTIMLGAAGGSTNTPLGNTAGSTTVSTGATLDLNGYTLGTAEALTLNGIGVSNNGALTNGSATAVSYSGLITLGSAASIITNAGNLNITGTISGTYALTLGGSGSGSISSILGISTGTLTKTGSGSWTLSGVNTYSGATAINGGTLKIGSTTALGTSSITVNNGGALDLNGYTLSTARPLSLNGTGFSNGGALTNSSSTAVSFSGAITLASASSIGTTGNITASGIVSGGNDLTKVGTGTLSFGSTVTLNDLTISAGTLVAPSTTMYIAGDFTNNGAFTNNNGTINLNGTGAQAISGEAYYNLTLSNGGIKTLQGGASLNSSGVLTLTSGVLELGNYNLTINNTAVGAIAGTFGTSNMISTNSTGYLIRPASASVITYPLGGGGYYSPITFTASTGFTISARAVSSTSMGTGYIPKYWEALASASGKTITATFTYSSSEGGTPVSLKYNSAGTWIAPPTGTVSLGSYAATISSTTSIGTPATQWTIGIPNTYYSYKSGSWNDYTTWTSDPGGTTQVGSTIPSNNDFVVILTGRTVTLPSDISSTGLDVTINEGGFLDLSTYKFTGTGGLSALSGTGTLRIASSYFPTVTANNFVTSSGGTTEFYNSTGFTFPSQATYNNLIINKKGATITQLSDITLNGNLYVKGGTFRINSNTATTKLNLTINGNVTVDAGDSIIVGNGSTNSSTTSTEITGGTAPYLAYYENFHRVVIKGDFTNNGTVRFTNLNYPVYNLFPPIGSGSTSGAASVYFQGATDNILVCNGKTDFYNLILDKGTDQTYKLTVQPSAYSNFRLFGANISGGDITSPATTAPYPNLKKALWIRTGTLVLKGLTIIPSLTEGGTTGAPASDYIIPTNGAMVLDGPDVIVLATADDYGEVNTAYSVSGGTGAVNGVNTTGATNFQGLLVYGKLQVNDGYLSTRESAGLLYTSVASGQIELNGGVIDAKQFREYGTTGSGASYIQTGGTFILRGRFIRPVAYTSISDLTNTSGILSARNAVGTSITQGTFNINNSNNIFGMSGGTIRIYDACTTGSVNVAQILSSAANTNVTGGSFEFNPRTGTGTDATSHLIYSVAAPFGNVTVNQGAGCTTTVQLSNYPLTVLNNLTLTSGSLLANNLNVTVGGNFMVSGSGTYNSGTNTTTFNGSVNQIFTMNGAINNGAAGLYNMVINNSSNTVTLAGSLASLYVQGTFDLTKGTFNDGGKTVYVAKNVTNSGIHSGTGKIQLNGTVAQSIGGDGTGIFQNLELNNTTTSNAAPVSLGSNITVNGILNLLSSKIFSIGTFNMSLGASASVTATAFGNSCYIHSAGNSGDGGITKTYSSTSPATFTFPVGCFSTKRFSTYAYTPATIGFSSAPSTYGAITVIPVGYEHPATTVNGQSLTFYWHIKSSGFTGYSSKVTHNFNYSSSDINGTIGNYIPSVYNTSSYTWNSGVHANINTTTNIISDWSGPPASNNFIDGDYTAGDAAFGLLNIYYSLASGLWSSTSTWTFNSAHTGTPAGSVPGLNDIVVIGNNHTVSLYNNTAYPLNTASVKCASLQIDAGATLDIGNNSSSVFSTVVNSPLGNGTFRLTTTKASTGVNSDISTFIFPSGDFTDFNVNKGTTEFYTTTGDGNALYILPPIGYIGNMVLSPQGDAGAGDNLALPNVSSLTIYGDLTMNGTTDYSAIGMSWNTNNTYYNYSTLYTTVEKYVHVYGDLNVNGGSFTFFDDNYAQHLIVDKDVNISASNGANIIVWDKSFGYTPYNGGPTLTNTFAIGGNLYNNGVNNGVFDGLKLYVNSATPHYCDVTFQGSSNSSISGTGNTYFHNVIVNKGTTQTTTLTCDIGGTLSTPTDNWLNLQNGTFKFMRTNPSTDFTISTTTPFTVSSSAGLYVNYANSNNKNVLISNASANSSDMFLNGKLTLVNGKVYVGPVTSVAYNNDIEYSGGGASELEIQGGTLTVNGQIRMNSATTSGILKYTQSGGALTINGQSANTTNAKLEVFNDNSAFNMSGGTLTIVRGGGGTTYGDLYLRPGTSSVTGGTIIFNHSTTVQNYGLDANIPLNNLTITGYTGGSANAKVSLMVNPLVLKGDLTFSNAYSILNSNNIDVTIKGNLTNNGSASSYIYGTNLTTFNGTTQQLAGSSATNFYDLKVSPLTSFILNNGNAVTVNNNLELSYGTMDCGSYAVNVKGNLINNATYTDSQYGVILNGTASQQQVSGTGTFGRLELNNTKGANVINSLTLNKDLVLTNGVLDINQYLLTLGVNSNIGGAPFGSSKMVVSDGVYSNVGIKKVFGVISSATTFTYPLGVSGKYTPTVLTINSSGSVGSIRVNNINSHHPAVIDVNNVLQYYWEVESSGITGFAGNFAFNYLASDVKGGPENKYVEARMIIPGTSWSKGTTGADNVDETNHKITFNFSSESNLSGEYTAGNEIAIPDNIPVFTSNKNGTWNTPGIWTQTAGDPYTLTGGPNGFIVIINDTVTTDGNYCSAYRTTINNKLKIVSPYLYGHNFGTVDGSGTLCLESGTFPAGRFNTFLSCANNSTVEYSGTGTYTIVADLYDNIPNLLFSGSGTRVLPNKDLTICKVLNIKGPALDNSVYNKKLTILGSMLLTSGSFSSGSGNSATVSFAGSAAQTVSSFNGSNSFNNFEINNSYGLTLNGAIDVNGDLLLTNGKITSTATNILNLLNTSVSCVTPTGGSSSSYINGPMVKRLNQGDTYFQFPIGNATTLGDNLSLRATKTGTLNWTAEYVNPNSYTTYSSPLTAINENEYWKISTPSGGNAIVNIKWNPASNLTPLMTQNGISDMRVAEHDGTNWIGLTSTATGDNYNGSAETGSQITISSSGSKNYTLACVNTPKPRIRLAPVGSVCGTAGIPVTLSAAYTIYSPYTISYTKDGVAQTPINASSFPVTIPTVAGGGVYQLTGFTYNYPWGTIQSGVYDVTSVTVYAIPTTAAAGSDRSLCGATSVALAANTPSSGTGLWSIISGAGGTLSNPVSETSTFSGTNGSAYTLRWTITNGTCTSTDDVSISFPLLAAQPSNFIVSASTVCQGTTGVTYTVPNDATVSYAWNYSGTGASYSSSTNSVTVDYDNTATSGDLSVTATNSCNTSAARSLTVTVNPLPNIAAKTSTICSGSTFTVSPTNGTDVVPGGTTYSWSAPSVTGITGAASGTNAANISGTLTNTTNAAINVIYTVTPTSGTCTGSTFTVTVTVNPMPNIAVKTSTICSGSIFTVSPTNGTDIVPSGTTYTWTAPSLSGGITGSSAQSTAQTSISQTLTNSGTSVQTATYTVTPVSGSCTGSNFTITVTVNPVPVLTSTLTPGAVCGNLTFSYTPTSATTGTTFNWSRSTVTGISNSAASGTDNPNEILNNTTTSPVSVTYIYTLLANSCSNNQNVTVSVTPVPTGTISYTGTPFCKSLSTGLAVTLSGTGAYTGGTYSSGAGLTIDGSTGAIIPSTSTVNNYTVTYTIPASGGCSSVSVTTSVIIASNPTATIIPVSPSTCAGSGLVITAIPAGGSGSYTTHLWTGAGSSSLNSVSITAPTFTNNTAGNYALDYTVTDSNGCKGMANTSITVNPLPATGPVYRKPNN